MKNIQIHLRIILLIIIASLTFHSCESDEFQELNQILSETSTSGPVIAQNDISNLPVLIQKHLENTGVVGSVKHYNIKMAGTGAIKQKENGAWNDLSNTFYLTYKPISRFWFGEMSTSLGDMTGFDYYRNGKGRLSIRYIPNTSFQEADDDKLVISELITFMSEHVYNPGAFTNSYFTWKASTDSSVTVSVTDAGIFTTGIFFFDKDGFINRFISHERYKGSGSEAKIETWEVILSDYKRFEGILIPTKFKASWLQETGPFEYIHGSISGVSFDVENM